MRLIGGGGGWGRKGEAMNPIPCTSRGDDIKYRSIVDRYNHHLSHFEALFGKGVRRMTRYIATLHLRNIYHTFLFYCNSSAKSSSTFIAQAQFCTRGKIHECWLGNLNPAITAQAAGQVRMFNIARHFLII